MPGLGLLPSESAHRIFTPEFQEQKLRQGHYSMSATTLIADIADPTAECLLSGVKQTIYERVEYFRF